MGDTLSRQSHTKQAREKYQAALLIYEREYGKEHLTTAACRDNIVRNLFRKKDKLLSRPLDFLQPFIDMKESDLLTEKSKLRVNYYSGNQAATLDSLSPEDLLAQFVSLYDSETMSAVDKKHSSEELSSRIHPIARALLCKKLPSPFFGSIVNYQCPSCNEPVWVYELFSMFKGSPCFRCIGRVLKFKHRR